MNWTGQHGSLAWVSPLIFRQATGTSALHPVCRVCQALPGRLARQVRRLRLALSLSANVITFGYKSR